MRAIELLALHGAKRTANYQCADIGLEFLDRLARPLARVFHVSCRTRMESLDITFAHDAVRRQYYSTAILARLRELNTKGGRVLGVTACDLYVPVLTFVFGEAQMAGACAVISAHRLREEFYGLPPDDGLFLERLTKLALHELGHTFGLGHCSSWNCVMASTHAVERLDLKDAAFCRACLVELSAAGGGP